MNFPDLSEIEKCIESGVFKEELDKRKYLCYASFYGAYFTIRKLLEYGCNPNIEENFNDSNNTPLTISCFWGFPKSVSLLLEYGANPMKRNKEGMVPLEITNSIKCMKALLEYGVNIDYKNKEGFTRLMKASYLGNEEIVEFLINNGANINIRNNRGETAYDLAYKSDRLDICKLLKTK